jgi:hypothetical protein
LSVRSYINGEVCIIVPHTLILFKPPSSALPPGQPWADAPTTGERLFGPDYYADLLPDLGAAAIVALGSGGGYDPAPFTRRGLAHTALLPAGAAAAGPPPPSLAVVDEVVAQLEAAAAAGAAVAVHAAGGPRDRALLAAGLTRLGLLPGARAALAWLHLAWPPPAASDPLAAATASSPGPPTGPSLLAA